ncbi:MAG: alanine--glyoxylate aminotransferase family protein [Anaerolineales bacterium]|nr:alanine--glyoxylate aminotransferase family protein [Anaerolineales bacterium]
MVHPRVLAALAMPTVGHLDPYFQEVMDDVKNLLRYAFRTENDFAVPVSGTGSAGMEAALCNFIEPDDSVLICIIGYFGERMYDMATRYTPNVDRLEKPWGEAFTPAEIKAALQKKKYKLVALVHCETSTGILQPGIQEIAEAAHENGALCVLDTVASWPGVPVEVDGWDVDVTYSGSQKALSIPPGLAPITLSTRARDALRARKTKVANWYLDLQALDAYWGSGKRVYHHTAPVNMNYAMREGLRLVQEEGLENVHARHRTVAEQLWAGLESIGAPPRPPAELRSPTLTTAVIPQGVDDLKIRQRLLNEYNIEISGGFGPLAGQIWRIGLMGYSARQENVTLFLAALEGLLGK